MSKYVNLKCGNCGYSFTSGYTPGYVSVLGTSRVKCPNCFVINRKSSKPYSQFRFYDHLSFWTGRVFRIIFRGGLYGSLLGLGISYLFDSNDDGFIYGGMIFGLITNLVYGYYNIKFQIEQVEKEDNLNEKKISNTVQKLNPKVENLEIKLSETFPEYDSTKEYDNFYERSELSRIQYLHISKFQILTWPTNKMMVDKENKIFFQHTALWIKIEDKERFLKDKLGFNGPVYIQEDLVFDKLGKVLLYGYFESPRALTLLDQAKLYHIDKKNKMDDDWPYFVLSK
jgi:hypothetical protein